MSSDTTTSQASATPPTKAAPSIWDQLETVVLLLRRGQRFWLRGVASFVLVVAIGVPFSMTRPRKYMSETIILYRETLRASDVTGGENHGADPRRLGGRLRELLFSRASLEPLVRQFKLYPKLMERRGAVDAVDEMRKHVFFRARDGDTFAVSFESADAVEAEQVTAALGACIVEEASRRRNEQARLLKEFLDGESDRSLADLHEKEAALARFLSENPSFATRNPTTGAPNPGAPVEPLIAPTVPRSSDATLASLEARAAKIERRLHGAPATGTAPSPRPVLEAAPVPDPPDVVEARRALAQALARYTDRHPDVIAARARLKEAEAAAAERAQAAPNAATRVVATEVAAPPLDDAERQRLKDTLDDVNKQINERRAQLVAAGVPVTRVDPAKHVVQLEVEYRQLQREVGEARERQGVLDDRLFKARLAANSVQDDRNIEVQILDPAFKPTHPISTGRAVMLGATLMVALLFGLGVPMGFGFLDDRLHDQYDLQLLDLGPVLAMIPKPTPPPTKKKARG